LSFHSFKECVSCNLLSFQPVCHCFLKKHHQQQSEIALAWGMHNYPSTGLVPFCCMWTWHIFIACHWS
jgi:hypothetical protein